MFQEDKTADAEPGAMMLESGSASPFAKEAHVLGAVSMALELLGVPCEDVHRCGQAGYGAAAQAREPGCLSRRP